MHVQIVTCVRDFDIADRLKETIKEAFENKGIVSAIVEAITFYLHVNEEIKIVAELELYKEWGKKITLARKFKKTFTIPHRELISWAIEPIQQLVNEVLIEWEKWKTRHKNYKFGVWKGEILTYGIVWYRSDKYQNKYGRWST